MSTTTTTQVGIWDAIRMDPKKDLVETALACGLCFTRIRDYSVYNERATGDPVVVCHECVTNMIESRLKLLEKGS